MAEKTQNVDLYAPPTDEELAAVPETPKEHSLLYQFFVSGHPNKPGHEPVGDNVTSSDLAILGAIAPSFAYEGLPGVISKFMGRAAPEAAEATAQATKAAPVAEEAAKNTGSAWRMLKAGKNASMSDVMSAAKEGAAPAAEKVAESEAPNVFELGAQNREAALGAIKRAIDASWAGAKKAAPVVGSAAKMAGKAGAGLLGLHEISKLFGGHH